MPTYPRATLLTLAALASLSVAVDAAENQVSTFSGYHAGISLGGSQAGGKSYDYEGNWEAAGATYGLSQEWNAGVGMQFDYNVVESGLLYGLQASVSLLDGKGSHCNTGVCGTFNDSENDNIGYAPDGIASLNGRFGFLPGEATLLYATGGVSAASITDQGRDIGPLFEKNDVVLGYNVGAGIEVMFAQDKSLGIEGRYMNFRSSDFEMEGMDYGAEPEIMELKVIFNFHL